MSGCLARVYACLGVSRSAPSARLQARIDLGRVFCLSRRLVARSSMEVFDIEISVVAVDAVIMRMSAVLAYPWRAPRGAVHEVGVVHAD